MPAKPLKMLAALLCAAMLAACESEVPEPPQPTPEPQLMLDDAAYVLTAQDVEAPLDGGGALVAAVFNAAGPDGNAFNAALWHGVTVFAENFGYTAKDYTAASDEAADREAAFAAAAGEQPQIIVCGGEDMAAALHSVQEQYPTVNFLLLDAEPHSADYSDYTTGANVHSVLFRVEQAAWLAGYAAVAEGYTGLAVISAGAMPNSVRSAAGFIQGAEAAARQKGVQVSCRVWYNAAGHPADEVAARVTEWYDGGTQAVLALDSTILQGCLAAVQGGADARIITAGADQTGRDEAVLTTAVRCYSTAVQNKLYEYFAAGGTWSAATAGQTVELGVLENAVALPTVAWRFGSFTKAEYAAQYAALRDNGVTVESISDKNALPDTVNVTVLMQN